ncbi:MAG: VWA domain-containing protein [Chloroflexi bacterium]|nr:VWA domain-containing protein [Chloroflexota bacterium]
MKNIRSIPFLFVVTFFLLFTSACAASQDASKAYSRAVINRGEIVPAERIRINEYLNYYEQHFPEPTSEPLALDLRIGNRRLAPNGGEVWLQIGLQARKPSLAERTPLNLALVLDVSGSMGETGKLDYLKQSLTVFLQSLRPDDRIAIVAYSDEATLIRASQPVEDGRWIRRTVQSLKAGGWTNLHGGLMLGFEEVSKNFDIRRNNRVILLTDGRANRGVIDPQQIASDARAYTERGIYLSTIGLGIDLDDELLSTLAREGRGAYHFIDSYEEMDKVFFEEVEGLVERVANDVRVQIQPASGVQLTQVTGFEGTPPPRGAEVVMQDMGAGDSQVLIVRLQASPASPGERLLATVTLSYEDVFAQRQRRTSKEMRVRVEPGVVPDPLLDLDVHRNVTIVRSAEALKRIDQMFNSGQYLPAWRLAREMEVLLRDMARLTGDEQLRKDADLFWRYQQTLSQALGYDPALASDTEGSPRPDQERFPSAETSETLPTLEVR